MTTFPGLLIVVALAIAAPSTALAQSGSILPSPPLTASLAKRSIDIDGNGKSVLLVRSGAPRMQVGRLVGNQFQFTDQSDPGLAFRIVGVTDYDGNGKSDLIVQNTTQGEFGDVHVWTDFYSTTTRILRQVKQVWDVQVVGDLDGDGKGDLVWRYVVPNSPDTGVSYIWFSNGGNAPIVRKRGGAPLSWKLLGTADLNADGADDMVYLSPEGQLRILMATPNRTCANLTAGTIPTGFTALAIADFTGRNRGDVLLRNATTGQVALLALNASGIPLPNYTGDPDDRNAACTPSSLVIPGQPITLPFSDPTWQYYASGDYDGNGTFDIVWLKPDGTLAVWLMGSNGTVQSTIQNAGSTAAGFAASQGTTAWSPTGGSNLPNVGTINQPPTVSIAAPGNNAAVTVGKAYSVIANAADADGTVAKVEFFINAAKLGESSLSPYALSWTPTIAGMYAITAKATDDKGATTMSSAVTVTASAAVPPPTAPSAIEMPIEVLGAPGTEANVTFNLTASQAAQTQRLWLQTHNIRYAEKASIKINSGAWIALNNTTADMLGTSKTYGGVGGSFATLKMTLPVTAGALVAGVNTISFRFNVGNGLTIGYRVIGLNILDSTGQKLMPASSFQQADPAQWTSPSSAAVDINAGKSLWSSATLRSNSGSSATTLVARCGDCHTQNGADLKYFAYSNKSIIERAKFHGLTEVEGNQIASYIRALPVKAAGRPWNPPYQPGPGTSSKPNDEWAAGAGIENVPDDDWDTIKYIFPNGIKRDALMEGDSNQFKRFSSHDTPIAFQLPDWNHWLPEIHPYDAWGKTWFEGTPNYKHYQKIRIQLAGKSAAQITQWYRDSGNGSGDTYQSTGYFAMNAWNGYFPNQGRGTSVVDAIEAFLSTTLNGNNRITNPADAQKIYSMALWKMVKHLEINEEFQLTGVGPATTGVAWAGFDNTYALPRAWVGAERVVFDVSPFLTGLESGITGSASGNNAFNYDYLSNSWYQLQIILNAGQRSGPGHQVVDWGYAHGFLNGMDRSTNFSQSARNAVWALKGMDEGDNGREPNTEQGWSFKRATLSPLGLITNDLSEHSQFWLANASPEARQVLATLAQVWLEKNASWLPIQMSRYAPYDGASATKSGNEDGGTFDRPEYVVGAAPTYDYRVRSAAEATDLLMRRLVQYKSFPAALQNGYAAWTQAVWPGVDANGVARNNWLQFTLPRVGAAPAAPTSTAGAAARSVNVAWVRAAGVDSYNVKRADSPNGPFLTVAYFRTGTSYIDIAPLSGRTYYYRITANTGQNESADSISAAIAR